jgi:heat shock protein HslJ
MNGRSRLRLVAALATSLVLAACGSGGIASNPQAGGSEPGNLAGRVFLSTAITGRTLVPDSRVRLSFDAGQISANAGCNTMGGPVAIDGGRLVVGPLGMTEMACDPALMEQDRWLAGFLDGATIELDGATLRLANGGVVLTLLDREVADPDRPLEGTRWVVDGLVTGDAVSSMPAGVVAALTFAEGQVLVEGGCNSGGGTFEISDGTLLIGQLVLTDMACGPDAMAVEQAVTAVLSGTVVYTIEAGVLTLDAGGIGLVLRAAP